MFKVLCINGSQQENPQRLVPIARIEEGLFYTVIDTKRQNGRDYYVLDEKLLASGRIVLYRADRFIPIEDGEAGAKAREQLRKRDLGSEIP